MDEVEFIVDEYGNMLYRLCLVRLANEADAEDAVQDTYLKYIKKHPKFYSEEHRKAWLIRVAVNHCRDILRQNRAHLSEDIESIASTYASEEGEGNEVIRTLMLLPEKYSSVMMLHFAEGQDYKTIAKVIGKSESAVKMRIKKGRELFIKIYKGE